MHFVSFKTEALSGHLARALDELARVGFSLHTLGVATAGSVADVRIDYVADGTVSASTYLARIDRMPGVTSVRGGAVVPASRAA